MQFAAALRALRLSFALILVPRLFATFFLLPLLLSILVVFGQILATGVLLATTDTEPQNIARTYQTVKKKNLGRRIIYGSGDPLESFQVCRWKEIPGGGEAPPSKDCAPDRLDVALQVENPETFDSSDYERIWNGNVYKLHICRDCHPDVIISIKGDDVRTDIRSVYGALLVNIARFNDRIQERYIRVAQEFQDLKNTFGVLYFQPKGLAAPARISGIENTLAIILNIASLTIISLWLALKAHRKVLDYFARSGALLPMVAATGRGSFYAAIWILTMLRVGAFLAAAIPITAYALLEEGQDLTQHFAYAHDPYAFVLWLLSISAGLALATLVASIADLQQRHSIVSFAYRYIPLLLCAVGALLWAGTFLFEDSVSLAVRSMIVTLPILGMAPVLIAPLLQPGYYILGAHCVLTLGVLVLALRYNAHWFAAHLEEI